MGWGVAGPVLRGGKSMEKRRRRCTISKNRLPAK